jgi:hypothetical protein
MVEFRNYAEFILQPSIALYKFNPEYLVHRPIKLILHEGLVQFPHDLRQNKENQSQRCQ